MTLPTTGLLAAFDASVGVTASGGRVSAWADQSGMGNHAAQVNAALQPYVGTDYLGRPSVRFLAVKADGTSSTGGAEGTEMSLADALTVDAKNLSFFIVGRDYGATFSSSILSTTGYSAGLLRKIASVSAYPQVHVGARPTTIKPRLNPSLYGFTSGATAAAYTNNEAVTGLAGISAGTGTGLRLGAFSAASGHASFEALAVAVYQGVLSDADVAQLRAHYAALYGLRTTPYTKGVVFEGDSITYGLDIPGQQSYPVQLARPTITGWRQQNLGTSGATLTTLANRAAQVDGYRDVGHARSVLIGMIGRNDASAGTTADAYYAALVAYVQARVAAGWEVHWGTCLASANGTLNALMQAYNARIRGSALGGVGNGLVIDAGAAGVIDFGALPEFDTAADAANLTYFQVDATHPTAAGALKLADAVAPLLADTTPPPPDNPPPPTPPDPTPPPAAVVGGTFKTMLRLNGSAVALRDTAAPAQASVTQHGVTFSFAGPVLSGQFLNGDWWVAPDGDQPVLLTDISPAYDPTSLKHGWMVNPVSDRTHSYDGRLNAAGLGLAIPGWDPTLLPTLPLALPPDTSVIKAVSADSPNSTSATGHLPALQTAVVLTRLAAPPPADSFRPPYFGAVKPLLTLADVQQAKLPSLAPPVGVTPPALEWAAARFARVQLDHYWQWPSRYMHPIDNYRATPGAGPVRNYGNHLSMDQHDAMLRLMLNDKTWAEKRAALINVLQAGLDYYGAAKGGCKWYADGGHMVGRKEILTFAAVLFDHADMKTVAGNTAWDAFSENGHIYAGPQRALWGRPEPAVGDYWKRIETAVGKRDLRDPTGQIDGGDDTGDDYHMQTSASYSGAALIARLLPGGVSVWNHPAFFEYVDRWRTFGSWTQPDTEAARRPNHAARHGWKAAETSYRTPFETAMWNTHIVV